MFTEDSTFTTLCRIHGLTSVKGQEKNGSAGRIKVTDSFSSLGNGRHHVLVDGFSGPLAIKRDNIKLYNTKAVGRSIFVGVDRETIRETTFKATLNENSEVADASAVTGGAARSRGNLKALDNFVNNFYNPQNETHPIVVKSTDLNISRAMNRAALGDESVQLGEPLKEMFQGIKDKLAEPGQQNHNILFKFDPHVIHDDRFVPKEESLGPQRCQAVKAGTFQIYPCSLKGALDTLEIRYADPARETIIIHHELFLDYGVEESMAYPRHAAALGETDRLFPSVLAEVDPQAFWGAVLWLSHFTVVLQELNLPEGLVQEWKDLEEGKQKSRMIFEKYMKSYGYSVSTLKGPEENWGITNNNDLHIRVATDYSIAAFESVMSSTEKIASRLSTFQINTLNMFKGTDYDKFAGARTHFGEMLASALSENRFGGSALPFIDKAMISAGFSWDPVVRGGAAQDQQKARSQCSNCGSRNEKKVLGCARW
eukprot:scaffold16700_cov119-Cylindrotheca_fusiformis.AAC.3